MVPVVRSLQEHILRELRSYGHRVRSRYVGSGMSTSANQTQEHATEPQGSVMSGLGSWSEGFMNDPKHACSLPVALMTNQC
eukprot:52667-Eustigmatos_ZCMA.PRE.1